MDRVAGGMGAFRLSAAFRLPAAFLLSAGLFLLPASGGAQEHGRTLDLGLGLAAHVSAPTDPPRSRWGTSAVAGGDFLVRRRWSLGLRARAAWIPDDLARRNRWALLMETRLRPDGASAFYGIVGAGWGAATTVARDFDLVSIGDEGGWVGVAGAGFLPAGSRRVRPGAEAVLLRHDVPGGAVWTLTLMLRLRLRGSASGLVVREIVPGG